MTTKERLEALAGYFKRRAIHQEAAHHPVAFSEPCIGCDTPSDYPICPSCLLLNASTLQSAAQGDAEQVADRLYYMIRDIELDIPTMSAVDLKAEILSALTKGEDRAV